MHIRKLSAIALSAALLTGVAGIAPAFAAEKPKIKSEISETKTSMTIPVEDVTLKNTKVIIRVQYISVKSGKTKTKKFVKTLDANGDTTVTVKGLSANTQYKVSVQAKKDQSGSVYSDASSTKKVTTKK